MFNIFRESQFWYSVSVYLWLRVWILSSVQWWEREYQSVWDWRVELCPVWGDRRPDQSRGHSVQTHQWHLDWILRSCSIRNCWYVLWLFVFIQLLLPPIFKVRSFLNYRQRRRISLKNFNLKFWKFITDGDPPIKHTILKFFVISVCKMQRPCKISIKFALLYP